MADSTSRAGLMTELMAIMSSTAIVDLILLIGLIKASIAIVELAEKSVPKSISVNRRLNSNRRFKNKPTGPNLV